MSPHEPRRDNDPIDSGSDRAFGCTVGGILVGMAALKLWIAGAVTPTWLAVLALGAVLLGLGIVTPASLARPHRLWLRLGALIALVANPLILALLFIAVVTPMALLMRLVGKRPLRLAYDPSAATYWIPRDPAADRQASMKRQF